MPWISAQKWAIACTREALEDYGYPKRPLDPDRTAVILGNAMAGEKHYLTALRVYFPEYAHELAESAEFRDAAGSRCGATSRSELHERIGKRLPDYRRHACPANWPTALPDASPTSTTSTARTYVCDAACASAMAAISSRRRRLVANDFDAAVTGGIDRNMGAQTFVKFCKIGALSATGTRPYAEGADGFVMGEGAAIFLMKRLADAERDGDKIYAVLRGIGGIERRQRQGHYRAQPDRAEVLHRARLAECRAVARYRYADRRPRHFHSRGRRGGSAEHGGRAQRVTTFRSHSVALGSVKSNIGHLKGAAGAAGMLKIALALRDKVLPPSVHCEHPSPDIDFAHSPLYVNTELQPWTVPADVRATCRRERLRLWRHELPCRAGRAHSPQAERQRQAVSRGQ